jgi:hypothetical protein
VVSGGYDRQVESLPTRGIMLKEAAHDVMSHGLTGKVREICGCYNHHVVVIVLDILGEIGPHVDWLHGEDSSVVEVNAITQTVGQHRHHRAHAAVELRPFRKAYETDASSTGHVVCEHHGSRIVGHGAQLVEASPRQIRRSHTNMGSISGQAYVVPAGLQPAHYGAYGAIVL